MVVNSDQPETPIHVTTQEYINVLLVDGYEVDDCWHPETNKKPSDIVDTNKLI